MGVSYLIVEEVEQGEEATAWMDKFVGGGVSGDMLREGLPESPPTA